MREIVDMVLDWSSLEADYNKLKIQKTQLNEWVTEVIKDYMNEAKEKEICIQLQIDPNIEEVWFDKQKCQTVLSNLLMNALKFSKANSNIPAHKTENKHRKRRTEICWRKSRKS